MPERTLNYGTVALLETKAFMEVFAIDWKNSWRAHHDEIYAALRPAFVVHRIECDDKDNWAVFIRAAATDVSAVSIQIQSALRRAKVAYAGPTFVATHVGHYVIAEFNAEGGVPGYVSYRPSGRSAGRCGRI